jgi:adenylate cyclase
MLYDNYTNRIKDIVNKNHQKKMQLASRSFTNTISGVSNKRMAFKEQAEFSRKNQLNRQDLNSIMQQVNIDGATIGVHPDFQHLKGRDDTEMHYVVSVFIDIKGSTNLHKEYELEEIYQITNTIQTAAIYTCLALGGYVQRLQGDGLFAYFGGKSISKEKAVQSAMIACSMFTYFVKNDLKNIFLQDGVEDIKTRIGIDFGEDEDVMWANFGVGNVSELTTVSLHTSLACKMQANARPNGIVAGQYIKNRLKDCAELFDYVTDSKGLIDRYIFENEKKKFRYTQYAFNWYNYLKSLPFVQCDAQGSLYLVKIPLPSAVQSSVQPDKDYEALGALIGDSKPYLQHDQNR